MIRRPLNARAHTMKIMQQLRSAAITIVLGAALLPAHAQSDKAKGKDKTPVPTIVTQPTLNVTYNPPQPTAGQSFRTTWTTNNSGNAISYACTAPSTGNNTAGDLGSGSGFVDQIAQQAWVGNDASCTYTADNGTGTKTVTLTLHTLSPAIPAPTINVWRSPANMTEGRAYTLSWSTTNATSVTRNCTSSGGGFTYNGQMSVQGPENGTASSSWVGHPSNCTWTATNSSGTATFAESMYTAAAPTINVLRNPATMTDGQPYTLTWSTSNAVSLTRVCTSSGSGFTYNGAMALQGPENGTASSNWVGYPSNCTWTATNSVGATTQFIEPMNTQPKAVPAPTINVWRTPGTMTAGYAYTLNWSTSNATSLTRTCTASGTGFTSSGGMALQGPENGTASASWAGYPSTCTWTATGAGGSTSFTEPMTTILPPTIDVSRTPNPMTAGQNYTLTWNTTNAVSLNRVCTSTGTGFTYNGTMALQGPETLPASSSWIGYPSTCTWTATNAAGVTAQKAETMTTVAANLAPTINVWRTPGTMTAGYAYTLNWSTSNATSLTRNCTASGTGFTSSGGMALQGPENGTASASWAGYPSTCTWTATGAGGSKTFTETMTTILPPTIDVSRTPNPMTAGQNYTLTWNTTNAVSLNRVCTSTGTGFTYNGTMALQGPETLPASSSWIGYPSTCTWTATNAAGVTAQKAETMTTQAAPAPTINVWRTPSPMTSGAAFTLNWTTTNTTSLTRSCTASGNGFTSSGAMSLQGPQAGTASSSWAGSPSTCTWTATGAGGTATFVETMTTNAPAVAGVTYIHTDGLGSPVARTNSSGGLVSVTRYEPYGMTASGATPTIGFTGHVNDAETGMTYMQQRYYDPVAGRFLSIDPITTDASNGGSFNRYSYVNNNPYKNIDPDGRSALTVEGCMVACTGVTLGYSNGEVALTLNFGIGLGGGISVDPRSGENGRTSYVDPDAVSAKYGGVALDGYTKAGIEVGILGKGIAIGGKLAGGKDLTAGKNVGGVSLELGGSKKEKTGVSGTAQSGAEVSVYVKPGAILKKTSDVLKGAGEAAAKKAKEIVDAAKQLAQIPKVD